MKWRIYFGDGSTFSDEDGDNIPARGVQVIVLADKDHGWSTQAGDDFYVWDDRGNGFRWWGVDIFGLIDFLLESRLVLLGRRIESKDFNEIFARASNDPDFRRKTSFANQERKP